MVITGKIYLGLFIFGSAFLLIVSTGLAQSPQDSLTLEKRVQKFLTEHRGTWHDMNVPEVDGQLLHDIILRNKYTSALEIGTSTGHSGIWIALALSKTGGKLITIEIDKDRYQEALSNFEEAGLSPYIDARLADAHQLVKELTGPFDFVFCDADKGWYKNYFIEVYPKLKKNGCFTAHNVYDSGWKRIWGGGTQEYYDYVRTLPDMETTLNQEGNGVSISFKRSD
jgi:caffeoyl-CoA O-methyltransferase